MTKDPSPRFLRFARALALASGVAPLGCGGNTGLHVPANDARPGQADTGAIHGGVGVDGAPGDMGAPDDALVVTIGPGPGFSMGIQMAPYDGGIIGTSVPPDAGPQDLGVVSGYDGRFLDIGPSPAFDAATEARPDANASDAVVVVVGLDAPVGPIPIPIGGPQAAPALPADWWGAGRA